MKKLVLILFMCGFAIGIITGNIFHRELYAPLSSLYNELYDKLSLLEINNSDIFFSALKRNLKFFILLYIFSVTNLWPFYCCSFSLYTGLTNGLFFMFNIIMYKTAGIFKFICFLFPQSIIYIPLYISIILRCHSLNRQLYSDNSKTDITKKGKLLIKQFPFILIYILLFLVCCLIESRINLQILILTSKMP